MLKVPVWAELGPAQPKFVFIFCSTDSRSMWVWSDTRAKLFLNFCVTADIFPISVGKYEQISLLILTIPACTSWHHAGKYRFIHFQSGTRGEYQEHMACRAEHSNISLRKKPTQGLVSESERNARPLLTLNFIRWWLNTTSPPHLPTLPNRIRTLDLRRLTQCKRLDINPIFLGWENIQKLSKIG